MTAGFGIPNLCKSLNVSLTLYSFPAVNPIPAEDQTYDPPRNSKPVFNLFGQDDELYDDRDHAFADVEPSIEELLFSLPERSEFGSLLPYSSQPSSDDLILSREVSIDSRLSSTASLSTRNFRMPLSAKAMLDGWIAANAESPYLKQGDAEALAHLTAITPSQVKIYVANSRLRKPSAGMIIQLFMVIHANHVFCRCSVISVQLNTLLAQL